MQLKFPLNFEGINLIIFIKITSQSPINYNDLNNIIDRILINSKQTVGTCTTPPEVTNTGVLVLLRPREV